MINHYLKYEVEVDIDNKLLVPTSQYWSTNIVSIEDIVLLKEQT